MTSRDSRLYLGHIRDAIAKDREPGIPWKGIAGMRDVVVHDYFEIDDEIVSRRLQRERSFRLTLPRGLWQHRVLGQPCENATKRAAPRGPRADGESIGGTKIGCCQPEDASHRRGGSSACTPRSRCP